MLAALTLLGWSAARAAEEGPRWASLTAAQQQALSPLQEGWPALEPERKQKWLEVAARFSALSPEGRSRVQARMAEWARMTPAERANARLTFQQAKQLTPLERQAFWEAYQGLPPEYRRQLAERGQAPQDPRAGSNPLPLTGALPKVNTAPVRAASAPPQLVTPTVVQRGGGVSTVLISSPTAPANTLPPGAPKVAADPSRVDPTTLLPRPQPASR